MGIKTETTFAFLFTYPYPPTQFTHRAYKIPSSMGVLVSAIRKELADDTDTKKSVDDALIGMKTAADKSMHIFYSDIEYVGREAAELSDVLFADIRH